MRRKKLTLVAENKPWGRYLTIFVATGAGLGYAPVFPGSFGTLIAIPLFLGLAWMEWWPYLAVVGLLTLAAVGIAGRAEEYFDSRDDQRIVIDEVVGFLITMTAARPTVLYVVVGYCLFRIFDIFKPWPCRSIHRMLEGGPGIVLDDVVAGVYAGVILYFLGRYFSL